MFFKKGGNNFFYLDGSPKRHSVIVVISRCLTGLIVFFLIGHCPEISTFDIESIGFKKLIADAETADQPKFKPVVFRAIEGIRLVIAIAIVLPKDTRGVDRFISRIYLVQDIRFHTLNAAALPVRSISTQIYETPEILATKRKPKTQRQLQIGVIILLVNARKESRPDDIIVFLNVGRGRLEAQPVEEPIAYRNANIPATHSIILRKWLTRVAGRQIIHVRPPFHAQVQLTPGWQTTQQHKYARRAAKGQYSHNSVV